MVRTLLLDFDNNAFDTADPPKGGVGVGAAYELAIGKLLGDDALASFRAAGGLRNRAPGEVLQELLPDRTDEEVVELTERLVADKLSYLARQIGTPIGNSFWPAPCNGFAQFWRWLGKKRLRTGVISSGHTAFIEQTFGVHGLWLPDVIVSEDDVRGRLDISPDQRVKPGTFQFELAQARLAEMYGESQSAANFPTGPEIIYFGDDAVKDGGFARAAGVRFGHFDPQASAEMTEFGFRFPTWKWVQDRFSELEG